MSQLFFPVCIVIGILLFYFLLRNDYDENKSLTKKGFVKLLVGMGVIFVAVTVFISFTG